MYIICSGKIVKISKYVLILLLFLTLPPIFGQSRYLENGISGSCLTINAVIDDGNYLSSGLSAAFSIGGIMDFGFDLNRETGNISSFDKTDWIFSFFYNIIVLKQTEFTPFSFQLEGTYGYTNSSSDYLDYYQYTRGGQGFKIGGSIYRDFLLGNSLSLIFGAKADYRNYVYTETNNQNPAAPVVNNTDRVENLRWGGLGAITFHPKSWPVFILETEVLYDQTDGSIIVEPSLLVISPSY